MSRPCISCRIIRSCKEVRTIIAKDPRRILTHSCPSFYGISSGEREVRRESIATFGVAVTAASLTTKAKEIHVTYSETDLSKMNRSALRKVAEGLGIAPSETGDRNKDELLALILEKQGGGSKKRKATKTTKKRGTKAATPSPEPEEEGEGEDELTPPVAEGREEPEPEPEPEPGSEEPELPDGLADQISQLRADIEQIGKEQDNVTELTIQNKRDLTRYMGVLDRKMNIIIGCWVAFARRNPEQLGEGFNPLKKEVSLSKKAKHTVSLGLLQRKTGEAVRDDGLQDPEEG